MDLTVRCGEGGAGIRCPVMFGLKLWIKHVQATHTFDMYVRTYSSYRKYMYFIYLPASVLMRWTVSTCVHRYIEDMSIRCRVLSLFLTQWLLCIGVRFQKMYAAMLTDETLRIAAFQKEKHGLWQEREHFQQKVRLPHTREQ